TSQSVVTAATSAKSAAKRACRSDCGERVISGSPSKGSRSSTDTVQAEMGGPDRRHHGAGRLPPAGRQDAVVEEARATADDFRCECQLQPIEFVGGEQLPDDRHAAEDPDVPGG